MITRSTRAKQTELEPYIDLTHISESEHILIDYVLAVVLNSDPIEP